jgi:phosphatidylinositol alpha-mannosyltransferase
VRIAVVCPYDLSRPGGVQGQCAGLSTALRAAGHEAVVVAPDDRPPGWAAGHVYAAGRAIPVSANGSVAPLALSPVAAARAHRAVAAWGADVVHLHEPLAPSLGYPFLTSRRWPVVATFHRSGIGGAYRLVAPLARWARSRLDVCCAVSEAARASAERLCGGSYEVLFNGVDLTRFRGDRRAQTGGQSGGHAPVVLFLGRHERRKGLEVLLEAFARLEPDADVRSPGGRRAELWVAGAGPETARLRARHPESTTVHWLGVLTDDEAAARIGEATVLCAPSLWGESFGMVVLEAMAAGTAVVASDIPGYREAAKGHARLVTPGDRGALAAALSAELEAHATGTDRTRRDAAVAQAEDWSMERLASRYVDAYRRAVAGRSAGIVERR